MAFKKPNAARKPTLLCVGTVGSFGAAHASKTEDSPYWMNDVEIRPSGAGQKTKFRLMWDPVFFSPDFSIKELDRSSEFVYKKNIASLDGPSLLEGLCGSDDAWTELNTAAEALPTDCTAEDVDAVLQGFFEQLGSVQFIYVLRQERKQDGFKEDGSKNYVLGPYYEVDQILHLNEATVKKLASRVKANAEKIEKAQAKGEDGPVKTVFKFDPADYGIDVEVPQSEPAWAA